MKVIRLLFPANRLRYFGAALLSILFAATVASWPQHVAGQQPALPKLTLSQVEQLVSHGVPDSTLSTQIQRRGLAFTPTPAIVESLRVKGAGPLTIAAIEVTIRGGPNSGSAGLHGPVAAAAPRYDASAPMLSEARRTIPIEVATIYRSLDEGNPQGARQFLSSDILNDAHHLDQICIPYTYRAHYIASIVERPGDLFETRVRVLIKPFKEVAQIFWFRASDGVFVATGVDPDQFSTDAEQAKESVRQFIFAAKGGRWEIAAHYASPHLPLDPLKSPKYTAYFDKITTANASFDKTLNEGGIRLLIRVDVRGGLWYLPDFLVDPSTGLIVRAFFRSPENIYSEVPDPAGVTDPDFEAYTLKRFGLPTASLSPAAEAAPNPVEKVAPSLEETIQFIQNNMKGQGPVDYVSTTSNRNNPSFISRMKVQSAEYNVVAELATCTLHVEFAESDSLETSVGGKTFAAGTYDQHSQIDATIPFKRVEGITVESRQNSLNHSFVAIGHPELSAAVAPSVFVVQLSASKPAFSAHVSTTKGSEAPQVSDNTGVLTEFLFRDEEMANRVSKAMRQAVDLCSGGN
jgi:hypothetical protein